MDKTVGKEAAKDDYDMMTTSGEGNCCNSIVYILGRRMVKNTTRAPRAQWKIESLARHKDCDVTE